MLNKPSVFDQALIELMIYDQLISETNYKKLLQLANKQPMLFWPFVCSHCHISEDMFMEYFAGFTGLEVVDVCMNNDIFTLTSSKLAKHLLKHHCILCSQEDNQLTVLIAMPAQLEWLQQWQTQQNYRVKTYICDLTSFLRISTTIKTRLAHQQCSSDQIEQTQSTVKNFLQHCMHFALAHHMSDIHGEMHADGMHIRMRKDGLLEQGYQFNQSIGKQITNCLKILSQCDVANTRLPQDGHMTIEGYPTGKQDARIHFCPTIHGEKWVIRLLPQNRILDITELGFIEQDLQKIRHALSQPQGLILVTGPTGSGKTTTLYTFLQSLNTSSVNISTIEDPVEKQLDNINQIQINHAIGFDFATGLRSLLRQDPDILMVGEIRDKETAEIALKAAQTGHLVFATLHSNSTAQTISRLLAMGFHPELLSQTIIAIIAQRLARISNKPDTSKKSSRLAIYEVMSINQAMRHIIEKQPFQADMLEQQACIDGMTTLKQHARWLMKQKLIDEKEINRVLIH